MNYRLLTKVPGFNQLYSFYKSQERIRKVRRCTTSLKSSGVHASTKIAMALNRFITNDTKELKYLFDRIENERSNLTRNTEPLVDGTLGEAGPYDRDMTIGDANKASKPANAARFLALLSYCLKPKSILELGTNTGISSSYFAVGSKVNNPSLEIVTLD